MKRKVTLYYEVHPAAIKAFERFSHGYYSFDCYLGAASVATQVDVFPYELTAVSDRVWMEDGPNVTYVKNRAAGIVPVDLKEFMWMKLKSTPISP